MFASVPRPLLLLYTLPAYTGEIRAVEVHKGMERGGEDCVVRGSVVRGSVMRGRVVSGLSQELSHGDDTAGCTVPNALMATQQREKV